jgi:hypothetical protein
MLSAGTALLRALTGLIRHRVGLSGLVALLWLIRLILLIHGLHLLMIRRLIVHGADSKFESKSTYGVAQFFRREDRGFSWRNPTPNKAKSLSSLSFTEAGNNFFPGLFRFRFAKLLGNRARHRRDL